MKRASFNPKKCQISPSVKPSHALLQHTHLSLSEFLARPYSLTRYFQYIHALLSCWTEFSMMNLDLFFKSTKDGCVGENFISYATSYILSMTFCISSIPFETSCREIQAMCKTAHTKHDLPHASLMPVLPFQHHSLLTLSYAWPQHNTIGSDNTSLTTLKRVSALASGS